MTLRYGFRVGIHSGLADLVFDASLKHFAAVDQVDHRLKRKTALWTLS